MTTRTKISACPVRISGVATPYGFKTLGAFHKFLKQCTPGAKLYYGMSYVRAAQMLVIVERELKYPNAMAYFNH
jgi:hypothetical protein